MALSKLTKVQTLGIGSNIEVVGVITTGQFKSGTSNLHSSGVELTNLNVSGIATIGGNVSIGGTLTYQDVTNIDSVGIITARGNVEIGGFIKHLGDTNTMIGFPSDDTFSVTTNNVTRMTFTGNFIDLPDAGTFRLGNSNDLQIYHGSGGASNIVHSNTSQPLIISATGAGSIRFDTNSNERLRITSAGDVGIGVNDPDAKLEVLEDIFVKGSSGDGDTGIQIRSGSSALSNQHQIRTGGGNGNMLFLEAVGTDGIIAMKTAGSERLRIDSSGSVLVANSTGSRTNLSANADDIVIGNTSTSNETGITIFSTNTSSIRFNDASGTDAAIEYSHSARELRFNSAGNNRLQFGVNASNSPVFSFGTGHYSGDNNNHNQGDRASVKVGGYLHLESATGAGHNTRAGLGYNCYFHSLESFYCGTKSPSSGDNRPAAYGMAYGNHYFYSDASNTAHSAQAQLTMSKFMEINRNGRIKYGPNLVHQLHSQSFLMYPNNGSNNTTRLTFTGLISGTYIAQIGYYNAAGQGYGGACFHVSGYQTASYTYNVHEIVRWDNAGNSSISAVTKSGSNWYVDITNTHGSYTGGGEVSVHGDAQVTCTITYI